MMSKWVFFTVPILAVLLAAIVFLAGRYTAAAQPTAETTETPSEATPEATTRRQPAQSGQPERQDLGALADFDFEGWQMPTNTPQLSAPDSTDADLTEGEWEISWFAGATEQMQGATGENPWPAFEAAQPALWPTFPDQPNPLVPSFRVVNGNEVPDGLHYGEDETNQCENDVCDFVVPAWHYRYNSGDYDMGFDRCLAGEEFSGCAIMIVNVGDVSANFESVMCDSCFTNWGQYFNGDTLPVAINARLSHGAYRMLYEEGGSNPGANCSVPAGCTTVRLTFVILSGNEVLGIGRTYVTKDNNSG